MPKKKVISMLEFLRTGTFGGLSVGADVNDLAHDFGKPIYIKEYKDLTTKWVYEDVDFYVNLELQKVYGIIIWGFRHKDDLGNRPRENKKFLIDPWLLRWESGIVKTQKALESENINFQHLSSTPGEGYETFRLESGVEIVFSEEPEWIDGKQIWTENPKFCYESIFNISRELAKTSSDFQYS